MSCYIDDVQAVLTSAECLVGFDPGVLVGLAL